MQVAQKTKRVTKAKIAAEAPLTGRTLVIVESPAKAKTIEKFLNSLSSDNNFIVDYSAGHVRELVSKVEHVPKEHIPYVVHKDLNIKSSTLGIDVHNNFKPLYKIIDGKKKIIDRLKDHTSKVDQIIFATDEDREGEAISWHLLDLLKPKVPYKRAVFHEITKSAILEAFNNPRDIDMNLVNAQEARSLLDKLTGYTLSPLLWRYLTYGLSAGRVQSCGLQLIVEKEKKRWKFVPSNYYSLEASFQPRNVKKLKDQPFLAKLIKWNGAKVANEKDFDGLSGSVKSNQTIILDEEKSDAVMRWLSNYDKSGEDKPAFTITDRSEKVLSKHPSQPYITSSLQQDASRKLGFSPARAMSIAQRLYESGHITYMRTDSPTLSSAALDAIRHLVIGNFGEEYLGGKGHKGGSNSTSPKNAQEAHEAIRPALIDDTFKSSKELGLSGDDGKLYDLIYKRTIASQMKESKSLTVSFVIDAVDQTDSNQNATFRFSQTKIQFDGFLAVFGKTSANEAGNSIASEIMKLKVGQVLDLYEGALEAGARISPNLDEDEESKEEDDKGNEGNAAESVATKYPGIVSTAHVTRAPSRFTEASFIQELESVGVGRPSTYASILQVLKDRGYIIVDKRTVVPTVKGMFVNDFLQNHFPEFINEQFTAEMEKCLDFIANGKQDKQAFIHAFYLGSSNKGTDSTSSALLSSMDGLLKLIDDKIHANSFQRKAVVEVPCVKDLGVITARGQDLFFTNSLSSTPEPSSGSYFIKLPSEMMDVREITREKVLLLVDSYQEDVVSTGANNPTVTLGVFPGTKKSIQLKNGRYGRYLEMGKTKKVSIPQWIQESDLTLDKAIELLRLPIVVGRHPEFQSDIELSCVYGNFTASFTGSIQRVSLPPGLWIDDIIQNKNNIFELIIYPKLKELAEKDAVGLWKDVPVQYHPLIFDAKTSKKSQSDNTAVAITFQIGPFGPYLKCGTLNCALDPKRFANKESIELSEAINLLKKRGDRKIAKESAAKAKKPIGFEEERIEEKPNSKAVGKKSKNNAILADEVSEPSEEKPKKKVGGKKSKNYTILEDEVSLTKPMKISRKKEDEQLLSPEDSTESGKDEVKKKSTRKKKVQVESDA